MPTLRLSGCGLPFLCASLVRLITQVGFSQLSILLTLRSLIMILVISTGRQGLKLHQRQHSISQRFRIYQLRPRDQGEAVGATRLQIFPSVCVKRDGLGLSIHVSTYRSFSLWLSENPKLSNSILVGGRFQTSLQVEANRNRSNI